jgi:sulfatase maturation enzyme AslB (radical SAM superfamily)
MIGAPEFESLADMESSDWLKKIKTQKWPMECQRCRETEAISETSIRLNTVKFHEKQTQPNYLIVGGILDNICNSACQFCNADLSTKIGSLHSRDYVRYNNADSFWKLPVDRIVHLDINGGEPSHSPAYRHLLANLPENIQSVRLNTNGSRVMTELIPLVNRGVQVTVTVSFDGTDRVHDYVRWPIRWQDFTKNIKEYQTMPVDLNLWTTLNALNIGDFPNILSWAGTHQLNHSWGILHQPNALDIKHVNPFTTAARKLFERGLDQRLVRLLGHVAVANDNSNEIFEYIRTQDQLRNISYQDYFTSL